MYRGHVFVKFNQLKDRKKYFTVKQSPLVVQYSIIRIFQMESELERFHKQNTQLELNITELRQKLKATEKEMHGERQRVRDVEAVVRRFKTDLHNCVGYIQDPKLLKESIRALYQKHVQEDIVSSLLDNCTVVQHLILVNLFYIVHHCENERFFLVLPLNMHANKLVFFLRRLKRQA